VIRWRFVVNLMVLLKVLVNWVSVDFVNCLDISIMFGIYLSYLHVSSV
jgi:hypothetical protein